jgi:HK97 family phage major capsid protein
MDVRDLRRQYFALVDEAEALANKADATADEVTRCQGRLDQAEALKQRIANLERAGSLAAERSNRPAGQIDQPATNPDGYRTLGLMLRDVASAAKAPHRSIPEMLQRRDVRAVMGMSEGVPSDGGFLLEPQHDRAIMERVYDSGQILSRCDQRTVGAGSNTLRVDEIDETSRADGSRWGGVIAYWEAEGDSVTGTSKLKFGQIDVKLEKLFALVYVTDEELQDLPQLESKVMSIVPQELRFKAEDGIIRGTGAGQIQGILNSASLVSVAKEAGQAVDTVVSENILNMWKSGWGRYNAVWLYNQELEDQLEKLVINIGTGGALMPLFSPPTGQQRYGTIKGRPAIPVEQASGPGDVGDFLLADFSQFILGTKGGIQSAASIHVQFLTDQSCFRFTWRVNGRSAWKSSLTPYKRTSSSYYQSPFVGLAAR